MNRRDLFKLALSTYFAPYLSLANTKRQQIRSKAKSIVFLHMNGGPSQIDLFDYKPELIKRDGQELTKFVSEKGQRGGVLKKPISKFKQRGKSGIWVSDLLPHIAEHVDDISLINSLNVSNLLHEFAQIEQFTGSTHQGSPHIGSWINYGLFENANLLRGNEYKLPGFFYFNDPIGPKRTFPLTLSNTLINGKQGYVVIDKINNFIKALDSTIYNKKEMNQFLSILEEIEEKPSSHLDYLNLMFNSREKIKDIIGKNEYDKETSKLYQVDEIGQNYLADQLILTTKLLKENVPYIQINVGNKEDETSWDNHFNSDDLVSMCKKTDFYIAKFLEDIKRQGLIDQVVIAWGGEFGRLPCIDIGDKPPNVVSSGRGHNNLAGAVWLTGTGIKKGFSFGKTDEIGLSTVENPVTYGDIWATLLHLIGLDHNQLKYIHEGQEMRYTKPEHKIIKQILS